MAKKVKDYYDVPYLEELAGKILAVTSNFNEEIFLKERAELPDWWYGELARRDVLFFSCNLDKSEVLDFIDRSEFYNEIVYVGRHAVFWGKYDEAEFLKSTYHKKLMKQDFYKKITIRNGNTFEKIGEILENEK